MSEKESTPKQESKPSVTHFDFQKEECENHIQKVLEFQKKFVGQKNHNPFKWIAENLTELNNRLTSGEKTVELQNAILKLPLVAPIVNPNPVEEQKSEPANIKLTPTGARLV